MTYSPLPTRVGDVRNVQSLSEQEYFIGCSQLLLYHGDLVARYTFIALKLLCDVLENIHGLCVVGHISGEHHFNDDLTNLAVVTR